MLPIFVVTPGFFVFVTLQLTGTVVLVATEAKAVQASVLMEETIDAWLPAESLQMTAVIAVAATRVTLVVAVSVDSAWEVAVIVTTLFVGTAAGAVYNPLVVLMVPLPVPLIDQFTSVLLVVLLRMVAVH